MKFIRAPIVSDITQTMVVTLEHPSTVSVNTTTSIHFISKPHPVPAAGPLEALCWISMATQLP